MNSPLNFKFTLSKKKGFCFSSIYFISIFVHFEVSGVIWGSYFFLCVVDGICRCWAEQSSLLWFLEVLKQLVICTTQPYLLFNAELPEGNKDQSQSMLLFFLRSFIHFILNHVST